VRAFVTGGTGFLGTHLVNALLAHGSAVTCLVRSPAKGEALARKGVRLLVGDLSAQETLEDGCRDADAVFHLAGLIAAQDLTQFMRTNRDGTATLLRAAEGRARRFVFVSSLAAAGPTTPGHPIDESRAPQPVTPYGASKLAGELLVRQAPVAWTVIRPPVIYGEWDRALFKLFVLARRGLVPVVGDGSQELSLVYGADIARALLAVVATDSTVGRVYFAAHPEVATARAVAEAVARALGRRARILPVPRSLARAAMATVGRLARLAGRSSVVSGERAAEFLAPAWTCRADALRRDAGWQARIDLTTGLERTAAWYQKEGWLK
jgi:nucleoside-diphosphate-sugar epimerase